MLYIIIILLNICQLYSSKTICINWITKIWQWYEHTEGENTDGEDKIPAHERTTLRG